MFGLHDCEVHAGIAFAKTIDMVPVWKEIETKFPYCKDRISKAFWGLWNAKRFPEAVSWKSGALRAHFLPNPFYNPVWSAFITSRVKMRIVPWLRETVHVFADSVITTCEMPTGVGVGDWKLVDHFKDWWGHWPGHYNDGEHVVKHSGVSSGGQSSVRLATEQPYEPPPTGGYEEEYEPGTYRWIKEDGGARQDMPDSASGGGAM